VLSVSPFGFERQPQHGPEFGFLVDQHARHLVDDTVESGGNVVRRDEPEIRVVPTVVVGAIGGLLVGTFVAIAAAVATLFLALFPDVMPSSTNAAFSLTATNASSTAYTLTIMTWVAAVFTPVVLVYTSWTYWTFRKRIGTRHIPASTLGIPASNAGTLH